MATSHLRIGATYAKLVDAAADPATVQALSPDGLEVVFTAGAAPAETVPGLRLQPGEAVNRSTGNGHIYGRVPASILHPPRAGIAIVVVDG